MADLAQVESRHVPAAASIALLLVTIHQSPDLALSAIRVSAFGVCVGVACETLIAAWLALIVTPTFSSQPYRLWRGLMHYTSGAFAMSGFVLAVVFWLTPLAFRTPGGWRSLSHFFIFLVSVIASILMPFWWLGALSRLIDERSGHGWRPLVAQFGAFAIVGAGALGAFKAFELFRAYF